MTRLSGAAMVAGVVGHPVTHSLSPLIHNAWIAAAGLDAVYAPFTPPADGFARFVEGLRGGAIRGLNVTIPFKEEALACADEISQAAALAGAANLLVFERDGTIRGDNTDGVGLLGALSAQAAGFDPAAGPVVILGAGGAARGAVAALVLAGAPDIRIINRTLTRAEGIAEMFDDRVQAVAENRIDTALSDAALVVNATSLGLGGGAGPVAPLERAPPHAVVMDMVYKPLRTEFLQRARAAGLRTADGLEMLIRQAAPSFEAFFGAPPPAEVDVRGLALAALGETA